MKLFYFVLQFKILSFCVYFQFVTSIKVIYTEPREFDWNTELKVTEISGPESETTAKSCLSRTIVSAIQSQLTIVHAINVTNSGTKPALNLQADSEAIFENVLKISSNLSVEQLMKCTPNETTIDELLKYCVNYGLLNQANFTQICPRQWDFGDVSRTWISGRKALIGLDTNELQHAIRMNGPAIATVCQSSDIHSNNIAGSCKHHTTGLLVGWSVTNDGQTAWRVQLCANQSTYANVTFAALGSIVYWPELETALTTDIDSFRHIWLYVFLAIAITSFMVFYVSAQILYKRHRYRKILVAQM